MIKRIYVDFRRERVFQEENFYSKEKYYFSDEKKNKIFKMEFSSLNYHE